MPQGMLQRVVKELRLAGPSLLTHRHVHLVNSNSVQLKCAKNHPRSHVAKLSVHMNVVPRSTMNTNGGAEN